MNLSTEDTCSHVSQKEMIVNLPGVPASIVGYRVDSTIGPVIQRVEY